MQTKAPPDTLKYAPGLGKIATIQQYAVVFRGAGGLVADDGTACTSVFNVVGGKGSHRANDVSLLPPTASLGRALVPQPSREFAE